MKRKVIRISLAFATYPYVDQNSFAILAIVCLKNNLTSP
jgi:hypothetical protein